MKPFGYRFTGNPLERAPRKLTKFHSVVSIFTQIITICSLSQKAHVFVQLQRQHIVQGNFFRQLQSTEKTKKKQKLKRH